MRIERYRSAAAAAVLAAVWGAADSVRADESAVPQTGEAVLFERGDVRLGVGVGTLGVGGHLGYRANDWVGVRGSVNYFTFSTDRRFNDVDFEADLDLLTAGVSVDVFPFQGGFRLTGGVFYNGNEVDLLATPVPGTSFTIGGETFDADELGRLDGGVDFNDVTPYLGLGYDGRLFSSVYISLDGGVLFQGSPDVRLRGEDVDPRIADRFDAALEAERRSVADDIDFLKFYPAVSVSLSYRF